MTARRLCLIACALFACRTGGDESVDAEPEVASAPVSQAESVEAAIAGISSAALARTVGWLASDERAGRPTPSAELVAAAHYVAAELGGAGLEPAAGKTFERLVPCGGGPDDSPIVAAMIRGTSDEAVMVSAHYDHIGEHGRGDDITFNGANDNASGVAAMLEIAAALARAPMTPRRSILFVAFCGEERGLRGSKHYAEHPLWPLERTVAMINLEMLGHPDPKDPKRAWITGYDRSNLATVFAQAGKTHGVTFVAGTEIGAVEGNAFHRSDNFPLAEQGVVAHTVAAGPLDEHYHAVTDEAALVDTDAMVPLTQAIARATWLLATGEFRPEWSPEGNPAIKRPLKP